LQLVRIRTRRAFQLASVLRALGLKSRGQSRAKCLPAGKAGRYEADLADRKGQPGQSGICRRVTRKKPPLSTARRSPQIPPTPERTITLPSPSTGSRLRRGAGGAGKSVVVGRQISSAAQSVGACRSPGKSRRGCGKAIQGSDRIGPAIRRGAEQSGVCMDSLARAPRQSSCFARPPKTTPNTVRPLRTWASF